MCPFRGLSGAGRPLSSTNARMNRKPAFPHVLSLTYKVGAEKWPWTQEIGCHEVGWAGTLRGEK